MEVSQWLRTLGLERYEAAFRDNKIDSELLPKLTAEDLKDLGVSLVGDRRRLLEAISALRPQGGTVVAQTAEPSERQVGRDEPPVGAERRQLTVMFCDLVGSTALSGRLDPEDMREIIGSYHRCVADTAARFNGFVAKYMGDGALLYFGYPQAHEDDAEQAVRAGLALIADVAGLQVSEPLQIRIGIGTGQVVVGDLITSGEGQERGVVGETPNLAARLQALAEPNTVVIGPQTRQLLGGLFECRDLGAVDVKGLSGPIRAYQVVRESATESRFEALHGTVLTPLVGRQEEVDLLWRQWNRAKGGEGRVVLISGEPGIGKSRLTAALHERIENEPHTRLRYFCSAHHQDSALHPIIAQLERAAGFQHSDTPGAKLDTLAAALVSASPLDGALLAELLSLPTDGRFPPVQLSPQRKKERTFEALLRQLEGLSVQRPVQMLFEDVHWMDPSTRELLDLTVERVPHLPVLLLVTFRPDFQPPWTGQAHVTALTLNRLDRHEGAALVRQVLGTEALPSEVVAEITERTDGVPLFVEELTKAVLESGNAKAALSRAAGAALNVPATLHASLMARLDRLGSAAKEVAQVGATLGREFPYELLASVAQRNAADLDAALDRLVAAGLMFRRGTPPQANFLFKHALVQDAAYGTLLRGKRQDLHRRIARVLEEKWPDTAEAQPELLAHHCSQAGLVEEAIAYYARAGQRAVARCATAEAIAQLSKGLELLVGRPDSDSRRRQELELQIALGRALIATQGYAVPGVEQAYARARALSERLDGSPQVVPILYGQLVYHLLKGPLRLAQAIAAELLQRGEQSADVPLIALGHRTSGLTCVHLGELLAARAHLEQALARYDPAHRPYYMSFHVQEPLVTLNFYLSQALLSLGYIDQARSHGDVAIQEARRLGHAYSLAAALQGTSWIDWTMRSLEEVQAKTDEVIAFSEEHGWPYPRAVGIFFRGWALAANGRTEEGLAHLEDGVTVYRETGSITQLPFLLTLFAAAKGAANRRDEGLEHLLEAEKLSSETGDRWYEAELNRVRGDLVLMSHDHATAESCYLEAIRIAQKQSGKFWELRAAVSLARLWCDQGKRRQAHDLLAPVYGWFTEGLETPDLREAKALLCELRS